MRTWTVDHTTDPAYIDLLLHLMKLHVHAYYGIINNFKKYMAAPSLAIQPSKNARIVANGAV